MLELKLESGGERRGKDWEFGVRRCKLLYREWIDNKVLLHSTGNYIQYPVIKQNGRQFFLKKRMYKNKYMLLQILL